MARSSPEHGLNAFSIQVSKYTFLSPTRGIVLSYQPLRLEDAEAMGLSGLYVYALSSPHRPNFCFVQLVPVSNPIAPESFLRVAWKESCWFDERPSSVLVHKGAAAAFSDLESNLGKIGLRCIRPTRENSRFAGVFRSLAQYGYQEFLWHDVKIPRDLASLAGANAFLMDLQSYHAGRLARLTEDRPPRVRFSPKGLRASRPVDASAVRRALVDGQARIPPVHCRIIDLDESLGPRHLTHYPIDREKAVYLVAGAGEVSRGAYEEFEARSRASLSDAARMRDRPVVNLAEARWNKADVARARHWQAFDPESFATEIGVRVRLVARLWPTGLEGLAAMAGVGKREMSWFVGRRFDLPMSCLERLALAFKVHDGYMRPYFRDVCLVLKAVSEKRTMEFLHSLGFVYACAEILPKIGQVDPYWRMLIAWESRRHALHPNGRILPHVLLFDAREPSYDDSILPARWLAYRLHEYGPFEISGEDYGAVLAECAAFCLDPFGSIDRLTSFWLDRQDFMTTLEDAHGRRAREDRRYGVIY